MEGEIVHVVDLGEPFGGFEAGMGGMDDVEPARCERLVELGPPRLAAF
jgi:hypothetical protein